MTARNPSSANQNKRLNIVLWCLQIVLAAVFAAAAITKLTMPIDNLIKMMPWASHVPAILVRLLGAAELAGSIGLIVPAATRFKPGLTPLAAGGLLLVMVAATVLHVSRGEISALPITIVLGAIAGLVIWGRSRLPIAPRG